MKYKHQDFYKLKTQDIINFAEKYNYIHRIDYKIAEETMETLNYFLKNYLIEDDFRLSFNISIKTFMRKDFVKTIEILMKKYSVSGKNLEIEITESIQIRDYQMLIKKLEKLIALGIEISLDDFTAGNSFKTLTNQVPVSIIKFDREILKDVNNSPSRKKSIYKELINLAKNLNLRIVAEGVENQIQLDFLKANNVDIIQGFFIGVPIPREKFTKLFLISKV